MAKLWERQIDDVTGKDEPDRAFLAFCAYRDLATEERSLAAATAVMRARWAAINPTEGGGWGQGTGKRISGQLESWSSKWNWVMRARAWDNERDRVRRRGQLQEIEAMSKRHAIQAEAGIRSLMIPITVLLQRLQMDPALYASMSTDSLLKYAIVATRALARAHNGERSARGLPALETAEEATLPVSGYDFTWVETSCECKHPHSSHNQQFAPDPSLTPCTEAGCTCQKFREVEKEIVD